MSGFFMDYDEVLRILFMVPPVKTNGLYSAISISFTSANAFALIPQSKQYKKASVVVSVIDCQLRIAILLRHLGHLSVSPVIISPPVVALKML